MKCIPDWKCISPKQITMYIASRNNGYGNAIYLQIPRIKIPIPLFVIFRAFDIISDKEICELIMLNIANENMKKMLFGLKASIIDANKYMTKELAIKFIVNNVIYTPMNMDKETGSKKKYDFAMEVLSNDIFPHCKTETQKIYMLGYMTNMLLQTSFGWLQESDRDSYINKRIDLTGPLLNNLLRNYFNKLVKDMKKQIIREINSGSWKSNDDYENIITKTNIYKIIKSTTIEQGIKRALATGDFGIKQINSNKVGVAQVLNRLTYLSSLSHLRRVNTPIDKSGKLVPPRRLHNSTWGFLCPAETPEGQSVGVVKNLAYLTHITINSNSSGLYDYILPIIQSLDTYDGSYKDLDDYAKVFINGSWVGITNDPEKVYVNLKEKNIKVLSIFIPQLYLIANLKKFECVMMLGVLVGHY
jgi:DNA-directed RNA polymerase II subunit RPB2